MRPLNRPHTSGASALASGRRGHLLLPNSVFLITHSSSPSERQPWSCAGRDPSTRFTDRRVPASVSGDARRTDSCRNRRGTRARHYPPQPNHLSAASSLPLTSGSLISQPKNPKGDAGAPYVRGGWSIAGESLRREPAALARAARISSRRSRRCASNPRLPGW